MFFAPAPCGMTRKTGLPGRYLQRWALELGHGIVASPLRWTPVRAKGARLATRAACRRSIAFTSMPH